MEPGKGCGDSPVIPAPLPGIMRAAGYDLGSSLTFQVVLNAGAAIGSIVVALLADRAGGFRVAITICECRCGTPGWECFRLDAGNVV
jgi:hypothetical protein